MYSVLKNATFRQHIIKYYSISLQLLEVISCHLHDHYYHETDHIIFKLLSGKKHQIQNWRPLSLSELTPMLFNTGLTYLGSEASNLKFNF